MVSLGSLAFFAVQVSKVTSGEDSGLEADLAVTGQRLVALQAAYVAGELGDQDCFDPTPHPASRHRTGYTGHVFSSAVETQNSCRCVEQS